MAMRKVLRFPHTIAAPKFCCTVPAREPGNLSDSTGQGRAVVGLPRLDSKVFQGLKVVRIPGNAPLSFPFGNTVLCQGGPDRGFRIGRAPDQRRRRRADVLVPCPEGREADCDRHRDTDHCHQPRGQECETPPLAEAVSAAQGP